MENEEERTKTVCGPKFKSRYFLASLASVGMGIVYGLKVALHVSIVSMVNHTALAGDGHAMPEDNCGFGEKLADDHKEVDGPYKWDAQIQGFILSSYFWGYIISLIPGGRLSEIFSGKWVMFFSVAINVVMMVLIPILSSLHWGVLVFARVLQGIGGGVTFPGMHVMLSRWAPPGERSVMSSITYAGTALGTVIYMLLSGVICEYISWEASFYLLGGVSGLWLIPWVLFIADSPNQQKFISQRERDFINDSLGVSAGVKKRKPPPLPLRLIFRSVPFWALLVAHTCGNWGFYMVLIELPMFMKTILHFNINGNSFLTALPFLTMYVFSSGLSSVLDYYRRRGKLSTTWARKIATEVASIFPLICFVAMMFVECERNLAVAIMTIMVTFQGGMFCGYLSNHIDLAPNFAGTLIAMTNTIATIPGIVVPLGVGELTKKDPSVKSWRIMFGITIGLYAIMIVVYGIFGSGEVQPWNEGDRREGEQQPLNETRPKKEEEK